MEENKSAGMERPSEEQLKNWLDKAIADNRQLVARLREVTDALNIMPYLFKVIEMKEVFGMERAEEARDLIGSLLFPGEKEEEDGGDKA